jgi:hypothetical protein
MQHQPFSWSMNTSAALHMLQRIPWQWSPWSQGQDVRMQGGGEGTRGPAPPLKHLHSVAPFRQQHGRYGASRTRTHNHHPPAQPA